MFKVKALALGCLLAATLVASGCKTTGGGSNPIYLIKVGKGDTLASIATKYDTTWEKIADLNPSGDRGPSSLMTVGRVLRVQPGPGGIVAGAATAQATSPAAAKAKRKKQLSQAALQGDAASASEFDEGDLPKDGDEAVNSKAARRASKPKAKGGLLFGDDDSASLHWPVQGEFSSLFGQRGRRMHQGIDIRAKTGTPIVAAGSGVVEFSGRKHGYGNCIIIKHANFSTLYAHMSSIDVSNGTRVDRETVIGEVGQTGNARGPHLHFEVHTHDGRSIDPMSIIAEDSLLSTTH